MGENGNKRHAFGVGRMLESQRTAAPVPASQQSDNFWNAPIAKTGIDCVSKIEFHSAPTVSFRAPE